MLWSQLGMSIFSLWSDLWRHHLPIGQIFDLGQLVHARRYPVAFEFWKSAQYFGRSQRGGGGETGRVTQQTPTRLGLTLGANDSVLLDFLGLFVIMVCHKIRAHSESHYGKKLSWSISPLRRYRRNTVFDLLTLNKIFNGMEKTMKEILWYGTITGVSYHIYRWKRIPWKKLWRNNDVKWSMMSNSKPGWGLVHQ